MKNEGEWEDFQEDIKRKKILKQNRRKQSPVFLTDVNEKNKMQLALEVSDCVKANYYAPHYCDFAQENLRKAQLTNQAFEQKRETAK